MPTQKLEYWPLPDGHDTDGATQLAFTSVNVVPDANAEYPDQLRLAADAWPRWRTTAGPWATAETAGPPTGRNAATSAVTKMVRRTVVSFPARCQRASEKNMER